MHQRMFNSPMEGGPSHKHLMEMLDILCQWHSKDMPDINSRDQKAIATYIVDNFSIGDIDRAHADRVEFYKNNNISRDRTNRDNNKYIMPTDSLEDIPNKYKNKFKPSDQDEKYVLREDYDNDIKAQAEILFDFEKKLKGQQKGIDNVQQIAQEGYNYARTGLTNLDLRMNRLEQHAPTIVHIKHPNAPTIELNTAHKQFPLLVKASNARLNDGARLNLWLYGPAGTGKTYAARELARVYFGDAYRSITWTDQVAKEFRERFNHDWEGHDYNGSLATQFQVFGYMDANGRYVSTAFRRMWEFGGVYLFDEIDGSMPDALLALQGALSSEYASFPDGLVRRHRDCIILAGANTTGMGGGIDYIGAMKQNSAFLNRWVYLKWPHDNALEDSLCKDKRWVSRVRHIRDGLVRENIRSHLVTMRQSFQGEALLEAGVDWHTVEEMTLRGALSDAQWERVSR